MSDYKGQGHHKGESTAQTLKKAFGWDNTPRFFKNPFFLGFLGTLFAGMILLSDRLEPQVELSKRDREWREEMIQQAKDRKQLAEIAKKDKQLGQVLENLRSQEQQLSQVKKDTPL